MPALPGRLAAAYRSDPGARDGTPRRVCSFTSVPPVLINPLAPIFAPPQKWYRTALGNNRHLVAMMTTPDRGNSAIGFRLRAPGPMLLRVINHVPLWAIVAAVLASMELYSV